MIIAILVVVGLCMGSFANALVWRLHEQSSATGKGHRADKRLSITKGRSMCPHCRHELAAQDLVPVLSWVYLRGKCRYCGKRISVQYPLVELTTAGLFVVSYLWWPQAFDPAQSAVFVLWLALITGLVALAVYDLRWSILPNRLIYPMGVIAAVQAAVVIATSANPGTALLDMVAAVVVGGGLFYLLFQVSKGRWIGGGDVKLGWLLGLIVGTPAAAALFIFIGSIIGSLVSVPLMAAGRLKRTSTIPFGPFLIAGAVITVLFGASILDWYSRTFVNL